MDLRGMSGDVLQACQRVSEPHPHGDEEEQDREITPGCRPLGSGRIADDTEEAEEYAVVQGRLATVVAPEDDGAFHVLTPCRGIRKSGLAFDLGSSFLSPLKIQRLRSTKLGTELFNGAPPGGKRGRRIGE
jgi:hypothetical protein